MYGFLLNKQQEKWLVDKYNIDVQTEQKRLDDNAKKTGRINKYTARYFITKEPELYVEKKENDLNIKLIGCPIDDNIYVGKLKKHVHGVKYNVDSEFEDSLKTLLENIKLDQYYKIKIISMDAHGLAYCGDGHPLNIEIYSNNKHETTVRLVNMDKYDLYCA